MKIEDLAGGNICFLIHLFSQCWCCSYFFLQNFPYCNATQVKKHVSLTILFFFSEKAERVTQRGKNFGLAYLMVTIFCTQKKREIVEMHSENSFGSQVATIRIRKKHFLIYGAANTTSMHFCTKKGNKNY